MEPVLKTGGQKCLVGSNPTPSAKWSHDNRVDRGSRPHAGATQALDVGRDGHLRRASDRAHRCGATADHRKTTWAGVGRRLTASPVMSAGSCRKVSRPSSSRLSRMVGDPSGRAGRRDARDMPVAAEDPVPGVCGDGVLKRLDSHCFIGRHRPRTRYCADEAVTTCARSGMSAPATESMVSESTPASPSAVAACPITRSKSASVMPRPACAASRSSPL